MEEEDPIWVRREKMRDIQGKEGWDLPFPVYLLGAGVAAIGAVSWIYAYALKHKFSMFVSKVLILV